MNYFWIDAVTHKIAVVTHVPVKLFESPNTASNPLGVTAKESLLGTAVHSCYIHGAVGINFYHIGQKCCKNLSDII